MLPNTNMANPGNVSVISDPDGDESDQFEQDAFGNLVSGGWSTRIGGITEQITTKPYDAALGRYYFNARWYDPQVGAFLSRDPLHYPISTGTSKPYSHCDNSPTTCTDPTGLLTTQGYTKLKAHGFEIDAACLCMIGNRVKDTTGLQFTNAQIALILAHTVSLSFQIWSEYTDLSEFADTLRCMKNDRFRTWCSQKDGRTLDGRTICAEYLDGKGVIYINSFSFHPYSEEEIAAGCQFGHNAIAYSMFHEKAHKCGWGKGIGNLFDRHPDGEQWQYIPCSDGHCNKKAFFKDINTDDSTTH